MSRARAVLALTAVATALLAPVASADLREECWNTVPTFRLSALVCSKVPGGVG